MPGCLEGSTWIPNIGIHNLQCITSSQVQVHGFFNLPNKLRVKCNLLCSEEEEPMVSYKLPSCIT